MEMISPKLRPQDVGFGKDDSHIIVNDWVETATAFDSEGRQLWSTRAMAKGVNGDNTLNIVGGDTPPGLYVLGSRTHDYNISGASPRYSRDLRSYGWIFYDMVECEDQERSRGRSEIGLHGGGSAAGWPGAWEPRQPLYPTYGCVRMHNIDLLELVDPLYNKGKVYVSVYQEDY